MAHTYWSHPCSTKWRSLPKFRTVLGYRSTTVNLRHSGLLIRCGFFAVLLYGDALRQTVNDNDHKFDPEVLNVVTNNLYVDTSAKWEQKASSSISKVSELWQLGGFCFTKWTSNNQKTVEHSCREDRENEVKQLNPDTVILSNEGGPGIHWSIGRQVLGFRIQVKRKACSKKGIFSATSSTCDPLALVSLFLSTAKTILQDVRGQGLKSNEEISRSLRKKWQKWISHHGLEDIQT